MGSSHTAGDSQPQALSSDSHPDLLDDAISTTNRLLKAFGAYPLLLLAVFYGYSRLKAATGIQNLWTLALIIACPFAAVFVFHTLPAWMRRARKRELEELGVKGRLADAGYFRLKPYEEGEKFDRADRAHHRVLRWIRESKCAILYLSGFSGTGKSSLLEAWVLPELRQEPSQFRVVEARTFSSASGAIRGALIKPGNVWKKPPTDEASLKELVEKSCAYLKPQRLLLVLDQFEEFVILHEPEERKDFECFLRSMVAAPVPGFKLLLVARSDYIGSIGEMDLPSLELHTNWEEVAAFAERDAMQFLEDSGLRIGFELKERILNEARQVEDTPGLIRPIILNLFGMVLKQSPDRLPKTSHPGALLSGYLRDIVNRPAIRDYAPRILTCMISGSGTKRPTRLSELALSVKADPHVVRGCLIRLGDEGLVRELDPVGGVWEVSHDFVARLLHYLLIGWRIRLWRRLQPWVAFAAVLGWLAVVGLLVPSYVRNRELTARQQLDRLGFSLSVGRQGLLARGAHLDDQRIREASWALGHLHGLTMIDLRGEHVSDLSSLNKLHNLRSLTFSGKNLSDLSSLREMHSLESLNLVGVSASDLSFLRELHNLQTLTIVGDPHLVDLSPIRELHNLQFLDLSSGIALDKHGEINLSPLGELHNLQSLNLSFNLISNLSALSGLYNLQTLNLQNNPFVSNLSALRNLDNLQSLDISNCPKVTDVGPLQNLHKLQSLLLHGTSVSDLDSVRELNSLQSLTLNGTRVSNLSPLCGLAKLSSVQASDLSQPAVQSLMKCRPTIKIE
jgi:Leucine-rich repeat (LRR) protein